MSSDGPYHNIRAAIARHGADSPQAAQLLTEMVEARRAAAAAAVIARHGADSPEAAQLVTEMVTSFATPADAAHLREVIARHGHRSWELIYLLAKIDYDRIKASALAAPAAAAAAAAAEAQGFVPSDRTSL